MLVVVGIFAADHVLRVLKTRIATATISPVPELDVTRIEIPSLNAGWRAGQHVRIRVLSFGMGWLGWHEVHPFTIASVDKGGEGVVLMCKTRGTWTSDLYEMAKAAGYEDQESGGGQTNVTVAIEGPYGLLFFIYE
jgi:ferric-chelate reductase